MLGAGGLQGLFVNFTIEELIPGLLHECNAAVQGEENFTTEGGVVVNDDMTEQNGHSTQLAPLPRK